MNTSLISIRSFTHKVWALWVRTKPLPKRIISCQLWGDPYGWYQNWRRLSSESVDKEYVWAKNLTSLKWASTWFIRRPFTYKVWDLWVRTKPWGGLGLAKEDNIMPIVSGSLHFFSIIFFSISSYHYSFSNPSPPFLVLLPIIAHLTITIPPTLNLFFYSSSPHFFFLL